MNMLVILIDGSMNVYVGQNLPNSTLLYVKFIVFQLYFNKAILK